MISRHTIFAFLLMLLVTAALFAWNNSKRDECDLAGPSRAMTQVPVGQSGKKVLLVNCSEWLPRQPAAVQAWCFADVALGVVFAMSLLGDAVRGNAYRSQFRR